MPGAHKLYIMTRIIFVLFLLLTTFSNCYADKQCIELIAFAMEKYHDRKYDEAIELLLRAEEEAQSDEDRYCLFLSKNNIGNIYAATLDYGEALNYYMEAYTLAIKYLEPKQEMTVLNNIAILYAKDNEVDKAWNFFHKGYIIAKDNKDDRRQAIYAANLGELSNTKKNWKESINYYNEALSFKNIPSHITNSAILGLASTYFHTKDFDKSEKLISRIAPSANQKEFDETEISALRFLAILNKEKMNYPKALKYATLALQHNNNLETKGHIYNLLSSIYSQEKKYELALSSKDSANNALIQANKIKISKVFEGNKIKIDIQNYQNTLKEQETQLQHHKYLLITIIIAVIIVLLLIAWIWRAHMIKTKQRKALYQHNQELIQLKLKETEQEKKLLEQSIKEKETRNLLENERLKNEVEKRNRELLAKALYISNRNHIILDLIQSLENSTNKNTSSGEEELIARLKDLVKTEEEWNFFVKHFEEVNQGFLIRLRKQHPILNSNDIRFISYVYMNLTTKEIASILCITPEAGRKRKERICKKIDLKEQSLYDYILSI